MSAMLHVFAMRAEEIAQIPANVLELFILQELHRLATVQVPHDEWDTKKEK
jgi:hypothetical protein